MVKIKQKPNSEHKQLAALIGRVIDEKTKTVLATKADLKQFITKADAKKLATKADLKQFATKADAKKLATKADLKQFATKNDLRRFATKNDLRRFATKADFWKLEDKFQEVKKQITHLPTKDEFYNTMDKVMKELETMRQENLVSVGMKRQVNEHEERIEVIETRLNIPLPGVSS